MTIAHLNFLFSVGKFFGIAVNKSIGVYRRTWAVVLIILFTALNFYCFAARMSIFVQYIHIKYVIRVVRYLLEYILGCTVIVDTNFTKKKFYWRLLQLLESVSATNRKKTILSNIKFISLNFFLLAVVLLAGFLLSAKVNSEVIFMMVFLIRGYYFLLYYDIFRTVFKIILEKYEKINISFKWKNWKKTNVLNSSFLLIEKSKKDLVILKRVVNLCNYIFGWPLLFFIVHSIVLLLDFIDSFFNVNSHLNRAKITMHHSFHVMLIVISSMGMVELILLCDCITKEAEKIVERCYKLRNKLDGEMRRDLNEFIDYYLLTQMPKFTAAGFFTIDKSLVTSVIGTVTSFLVILAQFDFK